MQDLSDEFPLPNIRSHRLRQYLYSRPDLLRTLTPPRSGYSHSQHHTSGPISFDFVNQDYSQRPIRKSGSFDAIHQALQNKTIENNFEKINNNELWSYVSNKDKSETENQIPRSKQETYLMDLLSDLPTDAKKTSDKEERKENRNPNQIREFTHEGSKEQEYTGNEKKNKAGTQKMNLSEIVIEHQTIQQKSSEQKAASIDDRQNQNNNNRELDNNRNHPVNNTMKKVPSLDVEAVNKSTPRSNLGKPTSLSARLDTTKSKDKPLISRAISPRSEYYFSPPEGSFSVKPEMCKNHANNHLSYVCVKDNCGELLCPLCLYEHQKIKHIGEYESLNNYGEKLKFRLADTYESLITSIEKIVMLQSEMSDKDKFEMEISEEINRIEESLIKNIRQFFDNLRDEYRSEVFFDHQKLSETLENLHQRANNIMQNLEEDLKYFAQPEPIPPSHFLGQLVQKNYYGSSQEVQKALNNIDQRLKHFLAVNRQMNTEKTTLELNPHLKSKLIVLLNESVKIKRKKTPRISSATEYEVQPKISPQNEELIKYYKELQKNDETDKDSSTFSRDLEPIEEQVNETPSVGRGRDSGERNTDKRTARTVSPFNKTGEKPVRDNTFKKINDNISNTVLEVYKTITPKTMTTGAQEKDLDIDTMKFLCEYIASNHNTTKIRVFDHEFFQLLFNTNNPIDFNYIEKGKLYFDMVAEYLTVDPSSKHKSVFTAHERLFFLVYVQPQWILAEIKTNIKTIIIYDYLGKFAKNRVSEGIFGLLFEIIRYEYKNKLNQNPENFAWEKKFAHHPSLVSKNPNDTGVLAIKIISNAYQNREFTNNRVSPNEIMMIRKKIEKIFKNLEEKRPGKFVAL